MKIGFFGDSFCMEESNPHSWFLNYETYIRKIKNNYKADIVNLGRPGSSYWDTILDQFTSVETPDVCIFCWTSHHRIYHPVVRNLTYSTVLDLKLKDIKLSNILNHGVVNAAKHYYKFLYDDRKAREEMISAFYRFDREVLSNLKNTKIIHLWCFEKSYDWQNGITVPVILKELSADSSPSAPNHFEGDAINSKLANLLIEIIDAK